MQNNYSYFQLSIGAVLSIAIGYGLMIGMIQIILKIAAA